MSPRKSTSDAKSPAGHGVHVGSSSVEQGESRNENELALNSARGMNQILKALGNNFGAIQRAHSSQHGKGPLAEYTYDKVGRLGPWFERPGLVFPQQLRDFVANVEPMKVIHAVMRRKVKRYGRQSLRRGELGWRIVQRREESKVDSDTREELEFIESFVRNCGNQPVPSKRRKLGRDKFSNYLAKVVDDSLTFDAMCTELEPLAHDDGLAGFYAVDGATIRRTDPESAATWNWSEDSNNKQQDMPPPDPKNPPEYIQLVDQQIKAWFTGDRLIYSLRNPSTDIYRRGYGQGEAEMVWKSSSALFMFMDLNLELLGDNMIPPGLLHVQGAPTTQSWLEELRTEIEAGRGKKHFSIPIWGTDAPQGREKLDIKWVPFFNWEDIQFEKLASFFTALLGGAYGVSPEEFFMKSFAGGGTSPLSGSDTEARIDVGITNGFIPIMHDVEEMVNEIVAEILPGKSEKYRFEFVGLEPGDISSERENDRLVLTVDEMRARRDEESHPNPVIGRAPLNPSLISLHMQQEGLDAQGGAATPEWSEMPGLEDLYGDDETKALEGLGGTDEGSLSGGAALRVQSLDRDMKEEVAGAGFLNADELREHARKLLEQSDKKDEE
jgi:hypothetical protein